MSQDTLETIIRHGLAVRQIPREVVSLFSVYKPRPDDEIVEKNGRQYIRRVRRPNHGGWWMCKQVPNSDTLVRWDIKRDNLAPTLAESVARFVYSV